MANEESDHPGLADIAGVGSRIRRFRKDVDISLSQLAARAKVSKGYLSALENADGSDQPARRPSAETLYAIAEALGVTMSDLLGRKLLTDPHSGPLPESLQKFAKQHRLPATDVKMLSAIKFRGEPPKTAERWWYIYNAIRNSESMDHDE